MMQCTISKRKDFILQKVPQAHRAGFSGDWPSVDMR
jgi:hypothetical protein